MTQVVRLIASSQPGRTTVGQTPFPIGIPVHLSDSMSSLSSPSPGVHARRFLPSFGPRGLMRFALVYLPIFLTTLACVTRS